VVPILIVLPFVPGITFNGTPNILNDEQVGKLRIGDLLNDDQQNPLLFHRALR
jgi:hypothetical protein